MKKDKAIDNIYEEREKFIIVGLTGRTGSGCTTVSKILSTEIFEELNLHEPKTTDFDTNEQRKYQIVYSYIKQHWSPFFRISMTDVIFSFIIQESFDNLIDKLSGIIGKELAKNISNELNAKFPNLRAEYFYLNKEISKIFGTDIHLDRSNRNNLKIAYNILIRLSSIQSKFREVMNNNIYIDKSNNTTVSTFTYCLQEFGNRIRNHGDINPDKEFSGIHMFALARRANDFIKAVQAVNKANNHPTFICLDAIRSPYEATYFQDRYSSFYLVAVSTDDNERIRRLGEKLSHEQIKALDSKEYPSKLKDESRFTNQDIGACLQLADIYLYNPYESTNEKYFITELIVKYITLMKHPGLITPTSVERCMQIAYNAKLNSGCLSRQVGAVITDSHYSVKAVGWNSVAEGQVPCNLRNAENYLINKDKSSFSTYELENQEFIDHMHKEYKRKIGLSSLKGRLCSYCFKDEYEQITLQKNQVHTRSLHAEENAFLQIVKYGGEGIQGGKLFTSASSCVLCSKKAFQLGIKDIFYIDPYPDIATSHILSFGKDKTKCPKCHLFYGAIGRAYTCLYTQRIAIKDELSCLYSD
ncbi:hypothetical protein [Candidatus Pseudoruminococcus sp.]|uniref:hypothetical protein n=1 Tax=Candidatus Pseudoruminococcus sp. TaxID=3101048 RepID=UPI00399BF6DA